jgi:hypothetical protein
MQTVPQALIMETMATSSGSARVRRWGSALSVPFAAVLLSGSTGAAFASTPTILVHGTRIISIAASSRALVWRSYSAAPYRGGPRCDAVIRSRRWGSGSVRTVFRCKPRSEGEPYGEMAAGASATVFTRVFLDFGGCCDSEFVTHLRTAARAGIDASDHFSGCGGDDIRGLAARGNLAAYGKLEWTSTSCPGNPDIGTETLTGGGVYTFPLPAGQPRPLAGTPPPAFIALSPTRLAVVPYDLTNPPVNKAPDPLPEIQIWDLATRSLERTIPETGVIRALAMSGDQIVVMTGVNGLRLDRFSASTGLRTTSRAISTKAAPTLAVYDRWIVYPVGSTIRVLNTRSNRIRIVATLAHPPHGVIAARGRAIWLAGTGTRVVATQLS